ncbi:hypothetical protein EUGRSUZ_G02491 [Eucalyptus grandis]|uniref:Uncharacterized protein n=2 Tax=Eucalyptus grandis TaxID=71139 RepID=A0ACC3K5X4_EUCGR|nr:hypothetical protein EUGRSUZ_G02491 [Eucalyptus grandis]
MFPQLLTSDPDADLYPVFDFLLHEALIPFPDLPKSVLRCPRILVCSVDAQLRPALAFLRHFGFVGRHAITCQTSLLLVSSVEHTLLPKIEFLQSLGLDHGEVSRMAIRSPGLLTMSVENNMRPKAEFFLRDMRGSLAELKRFPQYFSFSLERKIRPRHRMLEEHGLEMPLPEMLKISDGEFTSRLIEMRLRRVDARAAKNNFKRDIEAGCGIWVDSAFSSSIIYEVILILLLCFLAQDVYFSAKTFQSDIFYGYNQFVDSSSTKTTVAKLLSEDVESFSSLLDL